MASDRELLRVVKDLKHTVAELNNNYRDQGLPVTDGSHELQRFCAQLEFLLQYDMKEKKSLFGQRKDYWDFLCRVLTKVHSDGHAGVQHIASLDKLKTAVGKGRAFIRYCLVHRQLAESLQLCFMEPEVTSEWYYARSPFLNQKLWLDILGSLYELDGIDFHLALRRADLDVVWPMGSEVLPRCSNQTAVHTQVKPTSEVSSSIGDCESHQGCNNGHESPLGTKDLNVIESTADDLLRPGLEYSVEKWIGVWRSRKNSLLQMGSLLKLSPFMERSTQHSTSNKEGLVEVQRAHDELQTQEKKLNKAQPDSNSFAQDQHSFLPQPEPWLCGKMGKLHQGTTKGDSERKQKDLKMLMWELETLQQKVSQQQEENTSLRQELAEENLALKEKLSRLEAEYREKMEEQEKQQQELATAVTALKKAELKIASLASECQEAWAKKDAAEMSREEAEQRLSSLEAERRKQLADIEAQELRHHQLITRCQGLQEKLKMCEETLEKWETQVVALQDQHGQLGTSEVQHQGLSCGPAEMKEHPSMLERDLLKEKLKRSVAEMKALEREKETLMETLVSQEQNLVFTKLESQDLQKELSVCQEHAVTLRISLEAMEQTLRDREEVVQGLQGNLKNQSAQLQEALEKNTTMEAQLKAMGNKKFQVEAEAAEEQARTERILQELRNQLGTFEKEVAKLQEGGQQLQVMLQQALEEKEALEKQAENTTATLEGRIQEVAQLRNELENLKSNSQTLQKMLQEKNEIEVSALRQECIQLKNQVEQLELENMQATHTAEKLSAELEQCWRWPTEDSATQKTLAPVIVLDLASETRGDARGRAKERGTTGENSHGVAGLAGKEVIQTHVQQDLENAVEKGGDAKQRTETNGKHLIKHLDKMMSDVQQAKQTLLAKEKTTKHLKEQLSRSQQDKEQVQVLLEKSCQELEENEKKYKRELSDQGDLICNMKRKLLELLQEKDALWQKTEGMTSPVAYSAPSHSGMCAHCKKEFRLMSRRYQCRLCRSTVCHNCSVNSGHKERCCLPCYQRRNGQGI
ncbi:RUN and FYVE domain-containing protein 4 [Tiliqua scincoides]|uniref:RUN and FYVE domain-containing protein 4 n=1 Tax=Tiliqua scincoides TaxID=71010 RepID=UPI00346307A7